MKNFKTLAILMFAGTVFLSACEKKTVTNTPEAQEQVGQNVDPTNDNMASPVQENEMPEKVKAFMAQHYPNIAVSKYEMKSKTTGNEYEVKLDNGVEVEFDNAENWTEIKDYNGVPAALVPAKISSYVNQNYKDIKIKSLEKKMDKNRIDVDLLNGVELEFDMDGTFLRIDK